MLLMMNPSYGGFQQIDGQATSLKTKPKFFVYKYKKRNVAFSCLFWDSDCLKDMDLYPSYTERAGELDRDLKVKRESPGKSRLKAPFQLESISLKPSVVGG